MRVQLRHEPDAVFLDDPRRFYSGFVVQESFFGLQPGHSDVVSRSSVTFRVLEVDNINGMVNGHAELIG